MGTHTLCSLEHFPQQPPLGVLPHVPFVPAPLPCNCLKQKSWQWRTSTAHTTTIHSQLCLRGAWIPRCGTSTARSTLTFSLRTQRSTKDTATRRLSRHSLTRPTPSLSPRVPFTTTVSGRTRSSSPSSSGLTRCCQ